ncbi:MAG TPA: aminopeptidase P N-terminal domain-containing protein, partial [Candidatus Udaeobacter sp.]|nr:aminopeptidase P N-terminal domain-containing protein [Candidatus Udaeobacter sp.]
MSTNGGVDPKVFARRRGDFMKRLGGGVALLPTAPTRVRSNDTEYPFRADSDFYYLTGFAEPSAVAVLRPGKPKPFVLFVQPRDPLMETWNGRRAGPAGVKRHFGADEAFSIERFDEVLPHLLEGADRVFLAPGKYPEFDAKVNAIVDGFRRKSRTGVKPPAMVGDLRAVLHEMRLL